MWTAFFNLCAIGQRNRARFVEFAEVRIGLRIAIDDRFEGAAVRAALGHVDLVIAQQNLRIDHLPTLRTNAARELIEDVVCVLLPL